MEEVDGLGSGREVGRQVGVPKNKFGFKDCGKKEKNKNEAWEKKTLREKKIKIMRKKSSKIKKTTDQVN